MSHFFQQSPEPAEVTRKLFVVSGVLHRKGSSVFSRVLIFSPNGAINDSADVSAHERVGL